MDKILIKRGTKEKLDKSSPLSQGELFLAKDEERLYVGGPKGNIPIPSMEDLEDISSIVLSKQEPEKAEFWFEDKGDVPELEGGGGFQVKNAVVQPDEPEDKNNLWFKTRNE